MIWEGDALLHADFSRVGSDLLLTTADGTQFLILEYFSHINPATLLTEGGSALPGDLVSALAGPIAPGQYADVESTVGQQAIGRVDHTLGEVTATRVDGTAVALTKDSAIYQGDILETGSDGAVSILFIDETEFSLGTDGRMVLDELIFDPTSLEGTSTFSIIQGVFVFVSGEIAANNPEDMVVRTPVATIGIRGTKVAGRAAAEGDLNTITLMPEDSGVTGVITVSNTTGTVTLNSAFQTTIISSVFNEPAQPVTINANQANSLFGGVDQLLARNVSVRDADAQRGDENNSGQDGATGQSEASSSNQDSSEQEGDVEDEQEDLPEGEGELGAEGGEEGEEGLEGAIDASEEAQQDDGAVPVEEAVAGEKTVTDGSSREVSAADPSGEENALEAALISEHVAFDQFEAALESGESFGQAIEQAVIAQESLFDFISGVGAEAYLGSVQDYDGLGLGEAQSKNLYLEQDFDLRKMEVFSDQEQLAGLAETLSELGAFDEDDYGPQQAADEFGDLGHGEEEGISEDGGRFGPSEDLIYEESTAFIAGDPFITAFIADPIGFNSQQIFQFGSVQFFDPLFDPFAALQDALNELLGIQHFVEPENFEDARADLQDIFSLEELESANSINGTSSADTLTGTSGIDLINGQAGNDTIFGLGDDDGLLGGAGADVIDGGAGDDSIAGDGFSSDASASTIINLTESGDDGSDTISGGDGDDLIIGLGGDDVMFGNAGSDEIEGGSGNDLIDGGSGADVLDGGSGNDSIDGGSGNDRIDGDSGDDTLEGGEGDDHLEGISGNNTIIGDNGDDTLNGGSGNDSINGGNGADAIGGNAGDDIILGGPGNDGIAGDEGSDTITGGAGSDAITGGGGTDIFRFTSIADGSAVSSNVTRGTVSGDTYGEFEPEVDQFQFLSSAFGNLSTGTLSSSNFSDLSTAEYDGTNSQKSGAVFIYDDTNTLYFDPDTSVAGYTVIAETQSGISVSESDIAIVSS